MIKNIEMSYACAQNWTQRPDDIKPPKQPWPCPDQCLGLWGNPYESTYEGLKLKTCHHPSCQFSGDNYPCCVHMWSSLPKKCHHSGCRYFGK